MSQNQLHGDSVSYQRTDMQRDMVLKRLRESGCRITRQRKILLDVVLNEECTSCKEIYYKAVEIDPGIGIATVYRMVSLLEELGAINRKNMYRIFCQPKDGRTDTEGKEEVCRIELDDHSVCCLSQQNWNTVISEGLKACGYIDKQKVSRVLLS